MNYNKTKVEEFFKSYPNYRAVLEDFIKKEEDKINEKIGEGNIKELVEKSKKMLCYDVVDVKNCILPDSKYSLKLLNDDDPDCSLLKKKLRLHDKIQRLPPNVVSVNTNTTVAINGHKSIQSRSEQQNSN